MKCSSFVKFIAVMLSAATITAEMPFVLTSAATAPKLEIQNAYITPDTMPENRIVEVDIFISDNQSGFRSASFGIEYDASLIYTSCEASGRAGTVFDVVSNPEKNLLWFMGASSSADMAANTASREAMMKLYFEVPAEIEGGNFPVKFCWDGMNGASAFWYTDKTANVIETVKSTAVNGSVDFHGGSVMEPESLRMNQETQAQITIHNAATEVIWFSSDDKIASVSDKGLVTAVSAGECNIQAFIDNRLHTCHVVVNADDIYSIMDSADLVLTNPKRAVFMEYPDAEGEVTWMSAAPAQISIDSDGKLQFGTENCSARLFGTYNGKTYMRNVSVEYIQTTESDSDVLLGDADCNGQIDILDVIIVNKAILGKEQLTPQQDKNADFDGDGTVSSRDALNIMKRIVGII